ncbi:MAG: ABC-2 transporter permease [Chloroflexi bacterium]|nr:MAG: ABC-2 transporter permease [Chloroflexota bacterium]
MQQIFAFTWKDIRLWVQKPGSWMIVFVVPVIFIWIMHAVFGSSGTPVVTIFAVNLDESPEGAQVMDALQDAENLKIEQLPTREEAEKRVRAGQHLAAVVVPEDFGESLTTPDGAQIEIIVDPARADQASIVTGLVHAALGPLIIDAEVNRGVEAGIAAVMNSLATSTPQPGQFVTPQPEQVVTPQFEPASTAAARTDPVQKFFSAALKGVVSSQVEAALSDPQVSIVAQPFPEVSDKEAHKPSLLDYLVPGYSLMFVFFLIADLALTVVDERETGTLRRLLVAPIPLSRILLGKMAPYFLIAVVQFILVLLASRLIFGIDLGESTLGLAIIILASALSVVTLGILIAAFARSESQAAGLGGVVVLSMAVISGAMFPTIFIPGLQAITPHYWAMQGFLNIIARGQGVQGAMLPAGVLVTMSALFFAVGAIRFRFE